MAAYAGMKGDTHQDRLLAEARAMVVRDYLVRNFRLNDTRIRTIGLGKTDSNDNGIAVIVYTAEMIRTKPVSAITRSSTRTWP